MQDNDKTVFRGKIGTIEKIAFACNTFVLLVFLYDQIVGKLNMWLIVLPIVLIEVYLILFCLFPDEYCFLSDSLVIHRKFKRPIKITYDSVFNLDAEIKDAFLNITKSNNVKLYYEDRGKKKAIVCSLCETVNFVEMIKKRCGEFAETQKETDLDKIIR